MLNLSTFCSITQPGQAILVSKQSFVKKNYYRYSLTNTGLLGIYVNYGQEKF